MFSNNSKSSTPKPATAEQVWTESATKEEPESARAAAMLLQHIGESSRKSADEPVDFPAERTAETVQQPVGWRSFAAGAMGGAVVAGIAAVALSARLGSESLNTQGLPAPDAPAATNVATTGSALGRSQMPQSPAPVLLSPTRHQS